MIQTSRSPLITILPQFAISEFLTLEGTFSLYSADLCCQGIYLQTNAGDPKAVQSSCDSCLPGDLRMLGSNGVSGNKGLLRAQR